MKFGFEKPTPSDTNDISEKNQQELGNFKVSEKGELLYRKPGEEPEIKTVQDYIDFLDREVKHTVSSEEKNIPAKMLGYVEDPDDFEKKFESKIKKKSETEILAMIDNGIRDLSFAYESMRRVYDLVLGQRLEHRNVASSDENDKIKSKLNERIHEARAYQNNILKLQDFLDKKKADYISKAEKNGTISRDTEEEDKE